MERGEGEEEEEGDEREKRGRKKWEVDENRKGEGRVGGRKHREEMME